VQTVRLSSVAVCTSGALEHDSLSLSLSCFQLDESAKAGSSSIVKLKFLDMPADTDDENSEDDPDVDEKEIVLAHLVAGRVSRPFSPSSFAAHLTPFPRGSSPSTRLWT
jgi:hypothetical protein